MPWIVAASCKAALAEATRRWPDRNRAADGTIGDAAHAARTSDHNPDDQTSNDNRDADHVHEVHAFDLSHDPAHGCDCNVLAEHVRSRVLAGLETRVAYVIWDRRIFNPAVSPDWRPYTGADPHTGHIHCSILYSDSAENDTSDWWEIPSQAPEPSTLNPQPSTSTSTRPPANTSNHPPRTPHMMLNLKDSDYFFFVRGVADDNTLVLVALEKPEAWELVAAGVPNVVVTPALFDKVRKAPAWDRTP